MAHARMHFSNGWIFSRRLDLLAFSGTFLFGLIAYAILSWFQGRSNTDIWPWLTLLFVIGGDASHCYSTFMRTHLDPYEWKFRKFLLIGIPVAAYLALLLLSTATSTLTMWYVLLYMALWHFVRQQIGWVSWSARRGGESNPFDLRLDRLTIYASTVYPILILHTGQVQLTWWREMPFAQVVPHSAIPFMTAVYWGIIGLYILRQIQIVSLSKKLNFAKYQILFITWATWFITVIVLADPLSLMLLIVVGHAVPYLIVTYSYLSKSGSKVFEWLKPQLGISAFFLILPILFLAGYGERALRNVLLDHRASIIFPYEFINIPEFAVSLLIPLAALPTACHFLFDMYIWKLKLNASNSALASLSNNRTREAQ